MITDKTKTDSCGCLFPFCLQGGPKLLYDEIVYVIFYPAEHCPVYKTFLCCKYYQYKTEKECKIWR